MRFLIDEDVPAKLLHVLEEAGHEARRVNPSTPDPTIAAQARQEGRILVTLDSDFTNTSLYSPERFTIVHIRIHPPYADDITDAFTKLLAQLPPNQFKGLILLGRTGSLRILE